MNITNYRNADELPLAELTEQRKNHITQPRQHGSDKDDSGDDDDDLPLAELIKPGMDDINQATEPMQLSEDSIEKSVGTANDKDGGDESPLPELTPKGMDHIYQATEPMQFSGDSIEEAVGTDTNDEDGGDESSLPELISGHTQMECDAMHSCIERNKRGVTIHHPDQWIPVIQTARNRNRYEVTHMTKEDFLDLRQLTTPCVKYMKKDRAGNPVNWLKIRQIRVQRTDPSVIKIKYDFNEDFVEVRVSGSSRRNDMRLPLLYKQHLALSREKKQDLLSLCKDNIIPSMYHSYYENLTTEVQQSQSDESEEEENDGHMHQTSEQ
ncbi:uncharacterized protein [Diadema setosum]|uniref:uncharacterized protein n=1 Tax=Diadema setosum TaxID=31175 RepID=UPI003B3ACF0C